MQSQKLSKKALKVILNPAARICVCEPSLWEIAIKHRMSKLSLPLGLSGLYDEIQRSGYDIININRHHVEMFAALPILHTDPFDTMLIAIAKTENITIITKDDQIQKYDVRRVW